MSDTLPILTAQQWPFQSDTKAMNKFFGNPSVNNNIWVDNNLATIVPPWKMIYIEDNGKVSSITHFMFNKAAAASLIRVLQEIWNEYNQSQSAIEQVHLNEFGGTYNYRTIRGSNHISNHAYGAAIDLAPNHNELGADWVDGKGMMPLTAIKCFKAEGWRWGGDYHSRKDCMHFEAVR